MDNKSVVWAITLLEDAVIEFTSALELHRQVPYFLRQTFESRCQEEGLTDFRERIERINVWSQMAMRSAIFCVYDTKFILEMLLEDLDGASKDVIASELNKLKKQFKKIDQLRHAIAHKTEIALYPEKNKTNASWKTRGVTHIKGKGNSFIGNISGDTYSISRKGELLYFVLDEAGKEALVLLLKRVTRINIL